MAQPSQFRLQYLGAVQAKANVEYTASAFITVFPTANAFILKSKATETAPITVSINKTPAFRIDYNELSAFDGASALSYVFNKDCIIAVCNDLDVV